MSTLALLLALALAALTGCASDPFATAPESPEAAVLAAEKADPEAVVGLYAFEVKGGEPVDGIVYLDSNKDYRAHFSLNLAVGPEAARDLTTQYGQPPEKFFIGKRILARGLVHRVRIDFVERGQPTGQYYYQTHLEVLAADQIRLAP